LIPSTLAKYFRIVRRLEMQLSKIDLLKNRWLNFWANFMTIINSKAFAFYMVIALAGIFFFLGDTFKYQKIKTELMWQHQVKIWQENARKEDIEVKVKEIMGWYKCDSMTIRDAIMETFDPVLMSVLIGIESQYNSNAVSPMGALGLTQCMSDKFKKGDDWRDVRTNIKRGEEYLKYLLKVFKGNEKLALAAYNAGPGRVIGAGYKVPLNTKNNETGNYIVKATNALSKISDVRW
jgi:hypothetical protein